jgi:hypothetical protein
MHVVGHGDRNHLPHEAFELLSEVEIPKQQKVATRPCGEHDSTTDLNPRRVRPNRSKMIIPS